MRFKFAFIILSFFIYTKNLPIPFYSGYKARKAYQRKDYNCVKNILEKEQVNSPKDPELNYNLGTAYYKLREYEKAKSNFERATQNCSDDQKKLKEISYFNWGNSFYKNCLRVLGDDWEKKDVDEKKMEAAINEVERSIEKYRNVLVLNKKSEKAKINKKKTEELLKKLKQKQQQQQQQKQDQEKQEQEEKQQDKDQQQKDDEQKSQEQKKDKQDSMDQDSTEKDGKDKDSQEKEQKRNDGAQNGKENEQDGKDDKLDDEKRDKEEQSVDKKDEHDKDFQKEEQEKTGQPADESKKEKQEKQEIGVADQKDIEKELKEKGMRVILDNLQSDESKLQKKLIMQKSKGEQQRMSSKQKPW